jgi:hypothetical protein
VRREGNDCEQMGLVVVILVLIQREPKRAEKKIYEIADMYFFISYQNRVPSFLTSNEC